MADSQQNLLSIYGEPFLRYVLAIPDSDEILAGLVAATPEVAVVLNSLSSQVPLDTDGGHFHASMITATQVSQFLPEQQTSLANYLRAASGGAVGRVPNSSDAVLTGFRKLAADLWPTYLLPQPNQGSRTFWMSSPIGLYNHPALRSLITAFLADPSLSKLFPGAKYDEKDATQHYSIQALWMMNAGGGGSRQLVGVIGGVLLDAAIRAQTSGDTLAHEGMMTGLRGSLDALRKLAEGKTVNVPAVVGYSGVQLDPEQQISFTAGTLRQPNQVERSWLLNNSESVSAVFATTFPLQILSIGEHDVSDPEKFSKDFQKLAPRMEEAQVSFQRGLDQVRLSLLLCSQNEEFVATNEVSRFVTDPANAAGTASWSGDQRTPPAYPLSAQQADEAKDLHELIRTKHPESLNIGMKRLLSACSSRWDSNDAFIDALIVWENMFGTQTETMFRVTGALAKLIGPDDKEGRLVLQKELSDLYGIRSRLVHGATEPGTTKSWEYRQRSISVAIDAFKTLYKHRPDLLSLKSEERSKTLLLEP